MNIKLQFPIYAIPQKCALTQSLILESDQSEKLNKHPLNIPHMFNLSAPTHTCLFIFVNCKMHFNHTCCLNCGKTRLISANKNAENQTFEETTLEKLFE